MEPEGLLPQSQKPVTCPNRKSDPFTTCPYPTSSKCTLILYFNLRLNLPGGLFTPDFTAKILHTPLLSTIRATCPADLILLDLTTRMIFGVKHRS